MIEQSRRGSPRAASTARAQTMSYCSGRADALLSRGRNTMRAGAPIAPPLSWCSWKQSGGWRCLRGLVGQLGQIPVDASDLGFGARDVGREHGIAVRLELSTAGARAVDGEAK